MVSLARLLVGLGLIHVALGGESLIPTGLTKLRLLQASLRRSCRARAASPTIAADSPTSFATIRHLATALPIPRAINKARQREAGTLTRAGRQPGELWAFGKRAVRLEICNLTALSLPERSKRTWLRPAAIPALAGHTQGLYFPPGTRRPLAVHI